jgi:serine/threonine protein kinase
VHRDIKPENFLIGYGQNMSQIFVIDFGLSKKYKDLKTNKHIPFKEGKSLTGTARYASINAHLGREQSRRDDLESICYILVYLYKGNLPWQGISAKDKVEKYKEIAGRKTSQKLESLLKDLPSKLI